MLAPELVEQIRGMLADGRMSRRGVARELRVSRGAVDAIAQGRRPDYTAHCQDRTPGLDMPAGPIERCPGCGARVRMPCLACRLRALQQLQKRPAY